MRTPETFFTGQKGKRQNIASLEQGKIEDILENELLVDDDDSSSCCSEEKLSLDIVANSQKQVIDRETNVVAIDCEMVGVGSQNKSALARCSIVDYDGNVVFDSFIKPKEKITDYRTQWSGIRPSDMISAMPFRKARRKARNLLRGRILVGHSLQSDLNVLKLKHPLFSMRDTSKFVPLRTLAGLSRGITPSLKALSKNILQTDIQTSEHCSVEDARAALSLYKQCEEEWENEYREKKSTTYLCDAYWPSWTKMS